MKLCYRKQYQKVYFKVAIKLIRNKQNVIRIYEANITILHLQYHFEIIIIFITLVALILKFNSRDTQLMVSIKIKTVILDV